MLEHTEKSVFSMSSKSMLGLWSMSMGSESPVSWEQTEQLYISVMHQGTREYLLTTALMSMLDSDSNMAPHPWCLLSWSLIHLKYYGQASHSIS